MCYHNNTSSSEILLNVISINYNSLKTIPKRIVVLEYLKYFKRKMDDIDDSKSNHKYNFNKKVMLINLDQNVFI